jgi:hypothetical protein
MDSHYCPLKMESTQCRQSLEERTHISNSFNGNMFWVHFLLTAGNNRNLQIPIAYLSFLYMRECYIQNPWRVSIVRRKQTGGTQRDNATFHRFQILVAPTVGRHTDSSYSKTKILQKVLGRINRLLSLIRQEPL